MKANPQIKMMRTGKSSAAGGQRTATGPLASFCVGQNPAKSSRLGQIKDKASSDLSERMLLEHPCRLTCKTSRLGQRASAGMRQHKNKDERQRKDRGEEHEYHYSWPKQEQ